MRIKLIDLIRSVFFLRLESLTQLILIYRIVLLLVHFTDVDVPALETDSSLRSPLDAPSLGALIPNWSEWLSILLSVLPTVPLFAPSHAHSLHWRIVLLLQDEARG